MHRFLSAQVRDPFDPAPMLIQADWLEEIGDLVGAEVLRALAAAGIPSPAALAIVAGSDPPAGYFGPLDTFDRVEGSGEGKGDCLGYEVGYGDGNLEGYSSGEGIGDGEPTAAGVGSGEHFESDLGGDGEGEQLYADEAPG